MLVGIRTSSVGESRDTAGSAAASFSVCFGAVECSRSGALSSAFASSHAFFFACRGKPAGGFGVTRGRKVERAAKTPWKVMVG
jgi:hypothetical protein